MKVRAYKKQMSILACAFIVCAIPSAGYIANDDPNGSNNTPLRPPTQTPQQIAKGLAGREMSGNISPSLNAREAADFLLTPAILTQESISENVLITYPSE